MRSDQNAQPLNQPVEGNSGINMLPGYNGEVGPEEISNIYDPISLGYRSPTQTMPSAAPTPRGLQVNPALQSAGGWNVDPSGNLLNNLQTSSAGNWNIDQSGNLNDPGWFHKLLSLIGGVPSGLESIFNQHQVPQQPGQNGGLLMNNRTYNSYRSPFGQTYQQLSNPGSMIGPTSGAVSNPYTPGTVLGGRQPLGGPPSAAATAFSNTVKARNII